MACHCGPRLGAAVLGVGLILTACGTSEGRKATTQPLPSVPSATDTVVLAIIKNIMANGYDPSPSLNGGLGGLWINWRYGTSPLQTNLDSLGRPNSPSLNPPRHDVLTDLRYVHALWLYQRQHPDDRQFDGELRRYTAIVKAEFESPQNDQGWVYDEIADLYRLSNDAFYDQAAQSLAAYYDSLYRPQTGAVFDVSPDHPRGYYRSDRELEVGCALIQAGTRSSNATWIQHGRNMVAFVYAHAYLGDYHTFPIQLDEVLLPGGRANPDEKIYRATFRNSKIEGGSVKAGEVAQEILSLLHVYAVTHDRSFLDRATELLSSMTGQGDRIGLWDAINLGYYAAAVFPGPDVLHPGKPRVNTALKESGRQLQMLEAFHVANTLTGNAYADMEQVMAEVAIDKAFYPPAQGVLFEETADWTPLTLKDGSLQDWVTTEAMGIELEGLLSLKDPQPW